MIDNVRELTMPNFSGESMNKKVDSKSYRVRYLKVDLDDPSGIGQLESIMTKGLDGDEIVLGLTERYVFQDRIFILLQYLEKRQT